MKRVIISAMLLAGYFLASSSRADSPEQFDLDGREAVVRVYTHRLQGNGKAFREVTAVIGNLKFTLDVEDVNDSRSVMLFAEDQKDEVLRQFIGERFLRLPSQKGPKFCLPIGPTVLEGREVLVRLYEDWLKDPGAFVEVRLKVTDGGLKFDFDDAKGAAIVAVLGCEQQDPLIRQLFGCRTWAWVYRKAMRFSLPDKPPSVGEEELSWTFLDGLSNPISDAKVHVYFAPEQRRALIEEHVLDTQGHMKAGFCVGIGGVVAAESWIRTSRPLFVLSHPEYGTGWIQPHPCGSPYVVYAPLVPRTSQAYQRCAWGVVVDPDNNPVRGASVRCEALYPSGGEKVNAVSCQSSGVETDHQGRFRLYLPVEESSLQIGMMIPPDTNYSVTIEPPKELDLLPFEGQVSNGREAKITLERAGYFRTFVFQNQDGPITNLFELRNTHVTIKKPGKPDLKLKYNDWKDGGMFPLGRFEANMRGYKFQPLEVTANSPQQLVFKLPVETKLYYGQVFDAIKGRPIKGAFVIDFKRQMDEIDLSSLSTNQWDSLHALPAAVSISEKPLSRALSPVREYYSFYQLVRTDANGWFEMSLPVKSGVNELLVFEQDYLDIKVPLSSAKPDEYGAVELSVTKLFPAAKVVFEPWLEVRNKHMQFLILREWLIDKADCPDWAKHLIGWCSKEKQLKTRSGFGFDPDKVFSFYVPAGLKLRIKLRAWEKYQWGPPVFAGVGRLRQGQVLKLSRQQIQPGIPVFVEVLNTTSQPIEAVPVKACDQYDQVIHNTDANGVAIFDLAPNSKGEFIIECDVADANTSYLRQAIPYEIADVEDANNVYTLQVSDEILYHLFK